MYVCLCRGITDQDIKDAVANGAESYREIRDLLDLGTCCGRCAPEARSIISDELAEIAARISVAALALPLTLFNLLFYGSLFYGSTASCRTLTTPQISGFFYFSYSL